MSTQTTTPNNKIEKEITIGGIVYIATITGDVTLTPKTTTPPGPVDPNVPKPDSFGTIKDGAKWSKNPGKAETWKIVPMTDDPKKFKIVAADNLNVIADLESEDQAKKLIEYFKVNVFPPKQDGGVIDPDDPEKPDPDPKPVPTGELPYKVSEKVIKCSQRGPTTRHYASGAPDDNTIEKNGKEIPFKNHMGVFDITVPKEMEHDDNLSIKIGGDHMSNGWFDNGISIYEGQSCLGTEVKHPKTKKCIVKGKKYGDLRGKRVQVASTFFYDSNKTEYWVNIPGVTQGWDKAAEGTSIGGFKSKANGKWEVQLRIDGFKDIKVPPEIHNAAIYEIVS